MTQVAVEFRLVGAHWPETRLNLPAVPVSLAIHVVIIALLMWGMAARPLRRPAQPQSIEVEIVTELQFEDAFEIPSEVASVPLATPTPSPTPEPEAVPPARADGMTQATELFASRVLVDPENEQVRDTLPLLEETERITQLCNLEGLEQLHKVKPDPLPDSISPSAFAPTFVRGYTLEASEAAYRADRKWYRLRFVCTVSADFSGVAAYAFSVGDAIPEEEWDAHDLIAADDDE